MTAVLLLVAAAAGAAVRLVVVDQLDGELPVGSLVMGTVACFGAGALSQLGPPWPTVAVVGGLGAMSSWAETAQGVASLARSGHGQVAWLYLVASVAAGIVAAWLGLQVAG